ncbi:MAG: TonB-dependent receptor plug domain-containing protein [Gammaproteobacteria bacterium]|nr:TonB-dependent receptor plug domain-containing protein [Gammaproteobacteria bacterium]MDE0248679.1 TonB-dependent receptor plug domain-containing protein [Gammaproteobacteria bacterium]
MRLRPVFAAVTLPALVVSVLVSSRAAEAQERAAPGADGTVRLVGTVVDRLSGEPVPLASVEIAGPESARESVWTGLADGRGGFLTDPLVPGTYELRVAGRLFSPVSDLLLLEEPGVVDLRIEMVRARYELEPVIAAARRENLLERAGFYDRQITSGRTAVDREAIEVRDPHLVSDLLREFPGVQLRTGGELGRGADVRLRGGCRPLYVLDGVVLTGAGSLDEIVSVVDVEGMEVHQQASVPIEYRSLTNCGVIMLWTRDPGVPVRHEFSWRQAIWAGFAILTLIGAG